MKKLFLILLIGLVFGCSIEEDDTFTVFEFYVSGTGEVKEFLCNFNGIPKYKIIYGQDSSYFYFKFEGEETGTLNGTLENQGPDGYMRLYIYQYGEQLFYQEAIGGGAVINFNLNIN